MTQPDKLTIKEVDNFVKQARINPYSPSLAIAEQLADTMRENERLREQLHSLEQTALRSGYILAI